MAALSEVPSNNAVKRRKPVRTPPPIRIHDPNTGIEYIRKEMLGQGSFAECYLVESMRTRKNYAAKVIEKAHLKPKTKDRLYSEIKIHRGLTHPSVIKLEEVFEDANFVYILLEPCPHKTLLEMLRARLHLNEIEVRYWVHHVLDGIQYIHSQRVIHRDLKPGNIMIGADKDALRPKIGDFGLATMLGTPDERKKTICGTPNYIAPEILFNGDLGHSFEVDVWSLGVIMYTLLFGKPPFETAAVRETYKLIRAGKFEYPPSPAVSSSAKEMISWMLQVDPSKRPTVRQLTQHAWLRHESMPRSLPVRVLTSAPDQHLLRSEVLAMRSALRSIPLQNDQPNQIPMMDMMQPAGKKASDRGSGAAAELGVSEHGVSEHGVSVRAASSPHGGSFVLNWRDFSERYGMAYELLNGCIGACFNDNSRIVITAARDMVEYSEPILDADPPSTRTIQFSTRNPPQSLNKKIRLLNHFIEFFPRDPSLSMMACGDSYASASGISLQQDSSSSITMRQQSHASVPCVRRWKRGAQGMAFRLSHNLAQMNFIDHSKI